ncbi:MAG: TatD family hydrolase [Gemmatimonadaceae bacterium]|nr:TatD family hydrolase [Gemmatimonadaceae bacterium]
MLIDTHAHLNLPAFDNDWKETAKRALDAGIWMINVGDNLETSKKAVAMAEEFPEGVYAAVGLHPSEIFAEQFDISEYKKLAAHPKVVALGEVGLDYYRLPESVRPEGAGGALGNKQIKSPEEIKNLQKEVLIEFLRLGAEERLPVIIHCRDAHADMIPLLENFNRPVGPDARGVMHCFSGGFDEAKRYLNLGFLISFTGIITFSNFDQEILKKIPENKIMVETDCPYLTPVPHRGKRNEPLFVEFIAKELAKARGDTYGTIAEKTTKNTLTLFSKIKNLG